MAKIELIVVLSFALVLSTHGITEYIKTEVSSDGDANKETPASLEDVGLTTGELKKIGSEIKDAFQKIGGSVGQALSPEQEDQEIKEAAAGAPSGNFEDLVSSVVAEADAPSSDDAGAAYGPSSDGASAAADAAGAGAGSDAPSSDDAGAAGAGAAAGGAGDAPSSGDAGAAGDAPSSGDAGAAGGAPSADAGAAAGAPSSGDAGAAGGAASSDAGAADAASSGEGESAK